MSQAEQVVRVAALNTLIEATARLRKSPEPTAYAKADAYESVADALHNLTRNLSYDAVAVEHPEGG